MTKNVWKWPVSQKLKNLQVSDFGLQPISKEVSHTNESSLGKIWRTACKEVGIEGVRPYDGTRHSFASQLVNRGKSLEIIGEILGHSDIRTTKKYAHVHMDAMREAMED
jgi:site-specific recombinase XerD